MPPKRPKSGGKKKKGKKDGVDGDAQNAIEAKANILKELRAKYVDQCHKYATEPFPVLVKKIDAAIDKQEDISQIILHNLSINPNDVTPIRLAFKEYSTLRSLRFWQTKLSVNALHTILEFVDSRTRMTSLYLNENGIGKAHAEVLANFCRDSTHLVTFSLDHNPIEASATELFINLKGNHKSAIKTLSLRFCQIPSLCGPAIFEYLRDARLESIDLHGNVLMDSGLLGLADALRDNSTLKHLGLGFNEILDLPVGQDWPFEDLCRTLGSLNISLTNLDLSGNFFGDGDKGMAQILEMLQARKALYGTGKAAPLCCIMPERSNSALFSAAYELSTAMSGSGGGKSKKKGKKKK